LGLSLSYNKGSSTFVLESKTSGVQSKINIDDMSEGAITFLENLKIMEAGENDWVNKINGSTSPVEYENYTPPTDTVFKYNGQIYSRETTTFSLDGIDLTLTLEAAGTTGSPKTFDISISRDTSKPIEAIKKFIEEYNKLVDILTGHVNTARPKSDKYTYYEPLTEEQKEAMKEEDIKRWEEKAKTGLLHRDSILSGISSQMRTMAYTDVQLADGTYFSLYRIGITTTSNTKDGGKLQIDEEKLKAALEANPSKVEELFTKSAPTGDEAESMTYKVRNSKTGIAARMTAIIDGAVGLNGSIRDKAGIENTSSAFDNSLYRELSQYDRRLEDMMTYLQKREDYYYRMFARMEQAMAQSDSQTSALLASLGQG
jgi:flagellar hook-associated protein 2